MFSILKTQLTNSISSIINGDISSVIYQRHCSSADREKRLIYISLMTTNISQKKTKPESSYKSKHFTFAFFDLLFLKIGKSWGKYHGLLIICGR